MQYLLANWKMNGDRALIEAITAQSFEHIEPAQDLQVGIAVPATLLAWAKPAFQSHAWLGGQNIGAQAKGAFTGEISAQHMTEVGADFVLVGHSERRHLFHEADDVINLKVHQGVNHSLTVVLCVGETEQARVAGQTREVLRAQVENGLRDIKAEALGQLIIAYEPVWAIGSGQVPTETEITLAAEVIHQVVGDLYEDGRVSVLYGGSVKASNVQSIAGLPGISGVLVGGAALQVESFSQLLLAMQEIKG